ncbi:MAG: DUF2141 domain-containing protein [Candidatus Gracilibacteria bacterium]|nr:DUF2141 domain-containing protein [Candidatus Gracilibacteria bacterium]
MGFDEAFLYRKFTIFYVRKLSNIINCEKFFVTICGEDEEFPPKEGGKCMHSLQTKLIENKENNIIFNLPNGTYATACFCDKNNDEKLNTNWIGMPNEPYCVYKSNNKILKPNFKNSSFDIINRNTIINLEIKTP